MSNYDENLASEYFLKLRVDGNENLINLDLYVSSIKSLPFLSFLLFFFFFFIKAP